MFEVRHLRHAIALAEHRNFARAAKALHLTQSALTRSIQALEADLGERLFDRGTKSVELTHFGELFVQHAREVDLSMRDLLRAFDLSRGLDRGELRIGVGPFGAAMLVGPVIAQLSKAYPQCRIDTLVSPWRELPQRLLARDIDLMVVEISQLEPDERLQIHEMIPHRAAVVCRAGHPLARSKQIDKLHLASYPWAGPHLDARSSAQLSELTSAGIDQRRLSPINLTCDSSAMLKAIIAHSDALAVMNAFMVIDEVRSGQMSVLSGLDMGVSTRYGVAHLKRRTNSPAALAFIEFLLRHDAYIAAQEAVFLREAKGPRGIGLSQ
jgi:DNA-binding transcriptional LysR family regulator